MVKFHADRCFQVWTRDMPTHRALGGQKPLRQKLQLIEIASTSEKATHDGSFFKSIPHVKIHFLAHMISH